MLILSEVKKDEKVEAFGKRYGCAPRFANAPHQEPPKRKPVKVAGEQKMNWVEEELKGSDLKDKRRTKRLIRIVEDLSSQPNKSVPQASRDQAALQGLYDFWSNPRISAKDILSGHQKSTLVVRQLTDG